jgi:quaternary ammonium compound-resistance protein SugE
MPESPSPALAWTLLLIAGVFEVGWAMTLKQTEGFSRLWPTVLTLALMIVSFACLAQALRVIPVGTGYAVWTGIGTVGAATLGMLIYKEPATAGRLACIIMIVSGIVGLKLLSTR